MLRACRHPSKWHRCFRGWSIYLVFYWRCGPSLFLGVFPKQYSWFCRWLPALPFDFLIRIDITFFLANNLGFLFLSGRCGMRCFPFKFGLICGIILFAFVGGGHQNSGTSWCFDIYRCNLLCSHWFYRCDFNFGLFGITFLCWWGF